MLSVAGGIVLAVLILHGLFTGWLWLLMGVVFVGIVVFALTAWAGFQVFPDVSGAGELWVLVGAAALGLMFGLGTVGLLLDWSDRH